MSIFNIFKTEYRCQYCFNSYYIECKASHGKNICEDNRKCWDYRIVQNSERYAVQGLYIRSVMEYFLEYYDTIQTFKTLAQAKKFKDKLLIESGNKIVG